MDRNRLECEMIAAIYEAAVDPESWREVARLMAYFAQSHQSLLFLNRENGLQRVVSFGVDPDLEKKYLSLIDEDIWLIEARKLKAPTTVRSDDLIPLASYKKTTFFNEICVPANVAYMGGVVAAKNDSGVITYACQRSESKGPFSPEELKAMSGFARHFANATFLTASLQSDKEEIATLRSTLDRSNYGVIFCEYDGLIHWENRTASRILSQADGLRVCNGRLHADIDEDNIKLSNSIQKTAATAASRSTYSGSRISVRRKSHKPAYRLSVFPGSRKWTAGENARVVIFVADPCQPPVTSDSSLRQFFGLTEAEVRVCRQIWLGRTVPEIADHFSLSKHTVRAQLKSVFRKCEVSSQAQLMRILTTLEPR